jgi:hypothetical protein
MPLDHYVSQVHLKQFFSPALGSRLYATKKSDLKSFQCHSKDVCRIEDGSTNAYPINDRAIEEFLRGIEPNYDASISKLRQGASLTAARCSARRHEAMRESVGNYDADQATILRLVT